jgi:ribonuclease VapC
MTRVVLDASAIIAAILQEPGAQTVLAQVANAAVSTVNMAEVKGKLIDRGLSPADAWSAALSYSSEVLPFDSEQASIAGGLISASRAYRLSLGDRACLALAILLDVPVYTADKAWAKLDIGVKVHLLR